MIKGIEMHFKEPYKYFGDVLYHLSKSFMDKSKAFEYAKKRKSQSSPAKKVLVKIETDRNFGIKPVYHVFVRIINTDKKPNRRKK